MKDNRILKFAIIGLLFGIGGFLVGWYGVPKLIEYQLDKQYALVNGTIQYPMWLNLDVPINFDIYFFNVSNPNEVHNGARPILKEIGPFCYNMFRDKVVEEVSEDKEFITYYNRRTFYPTLERSGCLPHLTEVTILHMALMGPVHIINALAPDVLSTFGEAIPYLFPGLQNVFLTNTAQAILFDGVIMDCSSDEFTLQLICKNIDSMAPPQLWKHPNGRDYLFASFKYLNGTLEGPFKVNTGINNASLIGNTVEWKGKTKFEHWLTPECNEIKGGDGYTVFPLKGKKHITLFQSDVCRTLVTELELETEVSGLKAVKYGGKNSLNATEQNKCYCPKVFNHETSEYEIKCLKDGVVNLSPCLQAPVIMSWPHLLWADPEYTNYPIGLNPSVEKHEAAVYYEPITSSPLQGFRRGQMNMFLIKSEDITVLNNVSEGLFPMFWIEEGTGLPPNLLSMLKYFIYGLQVFEYVKGICVLIGVAFCIYAVTLYIREQYVAPTNKVQDIPENLHQVRAFNNFEQDLASFSIMELNKYPKSQQRTLQRNLDSDKRLSELHQNNYNAHQNTKF